MTTTNQKPTGLQKPAPVFSHPQAAAAEAKTVPPRRLPIGENNGVMFDSVAWDTAGAAVDLSFGCMFEREVPGSSLTGGLLHLDQELGGALTELREEGVFQAQELETLLITIPPAGIRARAVMVIGLGSPVTLTTDLLERATRLALTEAVRLGAKTVAFAPDILDAGHIKLPDDGATAMLKGVLGALDTERRLAALGFTSPPAIEHWTFDGGAEHLAPEAEDYRAAFQTLLSADQTSSAT